MKTLVLSILTSVFFTTTAISADVLAPNEKGIFLLTPANGELKGLKMQDRRGEPVIDQWKPGGSSITWKVDVPRAGLYTYEIIWSASMPFNSVLMTANGKKWLDWKIEITWNWQCYKVKRTKKAFLQEGVTDLAMSIPLSSKPSLINFAAIRLLPVALDKEIIDLKKRPCLGMTLEEMELLLGKSLPQEGSHPIDRTAPGDTDAALYEGLKEKIVSKMWIPEDDYIIDGCFLDNRCIALKVKQKDKTLTKALTHASTILPGTKFSNKGYKKGLEFVTDSQDENKMYKFYFWGDHYEVRAAGALRAMQKQ